MRPDPKRLRGGADQHRPSPFGRQNYTTLYKRKPIMTVTTNTLAGTRIHESGHATIGHALGMRVWEVAAPSSEPGSLGVTRAVPAHQPAAQLIFAIAGPIATRRFTGEPLDLGQESAETHTDFAHAVRAIAKMLEANPNQTARSIVAAAMNFAEKMVAEHWDEIELLAEAIKDAGGTLTGSALAEILGPMLPKTYICFVHQTESETTSFSSPEAAARADKAIDTAQRRLSAELAAAPAGDGESWDWSDPRDVPQAPQGPRRFNYHRTMFSGRGAKFGRIAGVMYK